MKRKQLYSLNRLMRQGAEIHPSNLKPLIVHAMSLHRSIRSQQRQIEALKSELKSKEA